MIKVVIGKRLVVLVFYLDFIDKKLDFQNRFPYDLGGGIKVYVSTPLHKKKKILQFQFLSLYLRAILLW